VAIRPDGMFAFRRAACIKHALLGKQYLGAVGVMTFTNLFFT
jgi:hypothetical protein